MYSWSCEANHVVKERGTALLATEPILNVGSSTYIFFSPTGESR